MDHSIPGSCAFVINSEPAVAYTGDFRMHGAKADSTRRFIQAGKNASILITEGTRVGRGQDEDVTERQVYETCLAAIEDDKGLAVADFSARNFERLYTFLEIAKQTARQLVVTSKDAYMLHALGCAEGRCLLEAEDSISIYSELKDKTGDKWETSIVAKNWPDRYVTHTNVSENPEKHILCLSFFDLKHLLDIEPKGGVYIYSSSEAFTEEDAIDFVRLSRWLEFFQITPQGFKIEGTGEQARPQFTKGFHASGHASMNDLENMINEIDPDHIIPVHTSDPQWFTRFNKTVLPEEGRTYDL